MKASGIRLKKPCKSLQYPLTSTIMSCKLCVGLFLTNIAGTPCPRDWTLFNSYCYLVNSSIKNWHQAQAYCHELEGELVKINSLEENEFVLALARKQAPSVEQVWIGLKRDPRINDFIWSDHSIPVYTNWAPNEPNGGEAELCGHMYTRRTDCLPNRASGYWNDLRCDAIRPGWHCGLVCKRLP